MNSQNQIIYPGQQPLAERLRHSKALIPTMAVMAVAVLGLAATLMVSHSQAQSDLAPLAAPANSSQALSPLPPAKPGVQTLGAKAVNPSGVLGTNAVQPQAGAPAVVARAVCVSCGVVESMTAVQHAAPASGVGAVAGGVVGGLLGNQLGHGNGRGAMTLLGAVGGGFAGNAIEKNMKKTTSYVMRIRMNDGSLRTVEQAGALPAGSQVVVEGHTAHLAVSGA